MKRKNSPEDILNYLEDASNLQTATATELVFPENETEVSEILKEYSGKKIYITPSGGGTGTVGGRLPSEGGILATDNLNKILNIDKKNKFVTVQPAVRIDSLLAELDKHELFYPPYPTEKLSFIGGNFSTNASGEYSFRYGDIRKYVRRARIALTTGEIIEIKRGSCFADRDGMFKFGKYVFSRPAYTSPDIKNSAGYFSKPGMDLIDLFIGSEGTLGVVTEIELSLIDKLAPSFSMIMFFNNENDLFGLYRFIKQNVKEKNTYINPFCLEYLDKFSLDFLKEDYPNIPAGSVGAIFLENEYVESEDKTLGIWEQLSEKYNPADVWFAGTHKDTNKFIDFRHKLPENINEYFRKQKMTKISIDIAVPDEKFDELLKYYRSAMEKTSMHYVLFGHIGENHLHFNLFPKENEKEEAQNIYLGAVTRAVSMGGTIAAEHGVGKLKHKYLEMMYGKEGVMEMARIKKIFDPACILSPDNIFPKELLK